MLGKVHRQGLYPTNITWLGYIYISYI
jgi:hypothetical protein